MSLGRIQRLRTPLILKPPTLGTFPYVVANGATGRLGPFNFSGYNTVSVKALISGFAAGDALELWLNTLDPESTAGDPLAGDLGATPILVVAGNGAVANTLNLPSLLSTPANQNLLLVADISKGSGVGWQGFGTPGANFPNLYTNINEPVPDDAGGMGITSGAGSIYVGRWADAVDPGTLTGFVLSLRCRDTSSGSTSKKVGVTITDSGNNTLWDGTNQQNFPDQNFSTLIYAVTFGAPPLAWTGLRLAIGGGGSTPPFDGFSDVSWTQLVMPGGGGGGGGAALAVPFHYNFLEWRNTGASSVTVESMVVELTNA